MDEDYEPGEEVEGYSNLVWMEGTIVDLYDYTIYDIEMDRHHVYKRPGDVRNPITHVTGPNGNLTLESEIEFRENGFWYPGILTGKNYRVSLRAYDGGIDVFEHDELRRVPTEAEIRARVQHWVEIHAAAQPHAVAQPAGVAYEIHNAFNSFNFDKFMEIINRANGTNINFKNRESPFQPIIDNINGNSNLSQEQKTELIQKMSTIIREITGYSRYEQNIDNITACVQYDLMQPQEFIDTYNQTFITDCLNAYSSGSGMSCVKGMYERIYFAFRDTVSTLCLDQIQGTGRSQLCKPEYIEIFDCFYESIPQEVLVEYSREWYREKGDELLGSLSEEARIEDFVEFVRSRINNEERFAAAERSIRKYANTEINILFGGRRRRRRRRTLNNSKRRTKRKSLNKGKRKSLRKGKGKTKKRY